MSASSDKTPRWVTRGELTRFRASFFADDAMTTPLVPYDPGLYPAYAIKDINGTTVQSGVATADVESGYWLVEYQVPRDAILTYDLKRWRIEWNFITNNNRQVDFVEEFDVRDTVITATETREIKKIALSGRQYQAFLRQTTRPYSLRMTLMLNGSPITAVQNISWPGDLKEHIDGDSFVYTYTIGDNILNGTCGYDILWEIQETPTSVINFEFQNILVVSPQLFQTMGSLRMLIDKFQKRLGRVQAYEDSDLVEYLAQGLQALNTWHPFTSFGMTNMPGPLHHFWVLLSGWWGLNAQFLNELDLSFSFSGQTTTLEYDHTSGLESALSRWQDYVNEHLTPAKTALLRASRPVGVAAGRPYRYNALHNFVYPISNFNSGSFVDILQHIGLL